MIKARLAIKSPTRPTNIEIGMHKVSIKNMHVYIYIFFLYGVYNIGNLLVYSKDRLLRNNSGSAAASG